MIGKKLQTGFISIQNFPLQQPPEIIIIMNYFAHFFNYMTQAQFWTSFKGEGFNHEVSMFVVGLDRSFDIKCLFVRKVMIKRCCFKTNRPGNLAHADSGVSFLSKQRDRGGQNFFFIVLFIITHDYNSPVA